MTSTTTTTGTALLFSILPGSVHDRKSSGWAESAGQRAESAVVFGQAFPQKRLVRRLSVSGVTFDTSPAARLTYHDLYPNLPSV